jgi:hypothetical protein
MYSGVWGYFLGWSRECIVSYRERINKIKKELERKEEKIQLNITNPSK